METKYDCWVDSICPIYDTFIVPYIDPFQIFDVKIIGTSTIHLPYIENISNHTISTTDKNHMIMLQRIGVDVLQILNNTHRKLFPLIQNQTQYMSRLMK